VGDWVEFRALGSFEVVVGGRLATPSAPKLRQALALMVLEHNKVVHTRSLIDELWGDDPPRQATQTVHQYIYELRRRLRRVCDPDEVLVTKPNGYMAPVAPESIDVTMAESLVREAAQALASRDPSTARQLLSEALALWRGEPLSNITCGKFLETFATRLQESWLHALELRIEADFQLNRHHELVGELKALSAAHPFHESIHGKLMLALYRCGRRNEALDVYRSLHRGLGHELGLAPGTQIQRLHQLMLFADPVLDPPSARRAITVSAPADPPAQLPGDIPDFVGRQELIGAVREVFSLHRDSTGVPIVSVTGMPGVGKTTAAVRIAHSIRGDYPDGQLFVNLSGTRGTSETAEHALGVLLRSVGISAELLEGLHERVAAFRTWTSRRRVLLVLDDADGATQVEPLVPAGSGCAVIVTNRCPLYGLPSVTTFRVGVLEVDEGVELLARIVGTNRVADEPAAAKEIVAAVGGLPLAIRLLGQRLAELGSQRLDQFVRGVTGGGARYRLVDLAHIGGDLRARFDSSYRRLNERDRAAFRLLAVLRGDEFTAAEAAEVFGDNVDSAEMTLLRLADANLVQVAGEDSVGGRRYRLHELIRPYTLDCIAANQHPAADAPAEPRRMGPDTPLATSDVWRGQRRGGQSADARPRAKAEVENKQPRARRPTS